jgi:hypothetical protein
MPPPLRIHRTTPRAGSTCTACSREPQLSSVSSRCPASSVRSIGRTSARSMLVGNSCQRLSSITTMDVIYFRARPRDSTRICFRRADLGQPLRKFNAAARAGAVQLAYAICTLAPEAAQAAATTSQTHRKSRAAMRTNTRSQAPYSRRRPTARVIRA